MNTDVSGRKGSGAMKRNRYCDGIWARVRRDYVSGEHSLREAAEKHGINFKAVESRARREGWKRALNENLQIVKDVASKIIQSRSAELGQQSAEFLGQCCEQLRILMDDFKARHGQAATLDEFERYVGAFTQLVRTGRELYGLDCETAQRPQQSLVQVQCLSQINVGPDGSLPEGMQVFDASPDLDLPDIDKAFPIAD